jgi:hypothetical protein
VQSDPLHCTHLCHGWTAWLHALHPVTPCPFVSQSPLPLTCWGAQRHSPVGFIAADGSALAWLQAVCKLTAVLWQCWQSRSVVWVIVVNTPGCWVQLAACCCLTCVPHSLFVWVGCGVQAAPVQGSQSPFAGGLALAGFCCTPALNAAVALLQVALELLSLSGVSCTDCVDVTTARCGHTPVQT